MIITTRSQQKLHIKWYDNLKTFITKKINNRNLFNQITYS